MSRGQAGFLSAFGSIFSALTQHSVDRRANRNAMEAALANARDAMAFGDNQARWAEWAAQENANMAMAMGGINAAMSSGMSYIDAARAIMEAKYNASMIFATGMYNAALIEYEKELMEQEFGLTKELYRRQTEKDASMILTAFAGSGIRIESSTDSAVGMSLASHYTEAAIQELMLTLSAEKQAEKLLLQAAQSRWDATTKAQATEFSGYSEAAARRISGLSSAVSSLAGAHISAQQALTQGRVDAQAHRANARLSARRFLQQAENARQSQIASRRALFGNIVSGLLGAASSAAGSQPSTTTNTKSSLGGTGGGGGISPRAQQPQTGSMLPASLSPSTLSSSGQFDWGIGKSSSTETASLVKRSLALRSSSLSHSIFRT